MRCIALITVTSLVKVSCTQGYWEVSRTSGDHTQSCHLASGSTCCSATASGPLHAVKLCYSSRRLTVDAFSYGSYTLDTLDASEPSLAQAGSFDTNQTSRGVWPFDGFPNEVKGHWNGSAFSLCHGAQCCYSPRQDSDKASVACTVPGSGKMDPMTITVKMKNDDHIYLRLETHGAHPAWYESWLGDGGISWGPAQAASRLNVNFSATGGPFQHEKVGADWIGPAEAASLLNVNLSATQGPFQHENAGADWITQQASLSSNKSVLV